MSTPASKIINSFLRKIEKDIDFFTYKNVSDEESMDIANDRAEEYLKESISRLLLAIVPDISFEYDEDSKEFKDDLTNIEIDILSSLMREKHYERDFSLLKAFQIQFSPKDLQVFSPANERKTFMDMYYGMVKDNNMQLNHYQSRDRISGKLKSIDYSEYNSE
ncbi:hypothetical protein H6F38_23115 [Paenibacillus sp. EKM208P]|nr:hypothetical protein H6F38_23115 [Paenibacillus sp. EKM208P]